MYSPPRIEERAPGRFIGMHMEMSLMEDQTGQLWRKFMPRRQEILHRTNTDVVSLQVYPKGYFLEFDPGRSFRKWALAEVGNLSEENGEKEHRGGLIPEGMEMFEMQGGLYAVFVHRGSDPAIFDFIYGEWLVSSDFELDDRPHFEVLDVQYRHSDPDAEEEIWIPIRVKY